jgi:hypothetical protein
MLELTLTAAQSFHEAAQHNFTTELAENNLTRHTEDELTKFKDLVSKTQDWFAQAKTKQEKLAPNLEPILRKAELQRRAKEVQAELERLGKKKRPRKPYTPPSSSSTSSSSTATSSSSASSAEATETTHSKDEL